MSRIDSPIRGKLLNKYVLLPSAVFLGITFSILYLNQLQSCTASDGSIPAYRPSYRGFTKDIACRKALAVCSYYSKDPGNCKVITDIK